MELECLAKVGGNKLCRREGKKNEGMPMDKKKRRQPPAVITAEHAKLKLCEVEQSLQRFVGVFVVFTRTYM